MPTWSRPRRVRRESGSIMMPVGQLQHDPCSHPSRISLGEKPFSAGFH